MAPLNSAPTNTTLGHKMLAGPKTDKQLQELRSLLQLPLMQANRTLALMCTLVGYSLSLSCCSHNQPTNHHPGAGASSQPGRLFRCLCPLHHLCLQPRPAQKEQHTPPATQDPVR